MPNGNSYWFPAKRYGWGWGPPTKWQGWVALLLWAAMVFAGLILLRHNPSQPFANIALVVLMGGVLTLICYWKGEPPKWRWGDRSE
jgi:lipoprotein signal peptidase